MFTEQDFENLVSRLQEVYGDFITDSSSLNLLLGDCQQVSAFNKLEMGVLKSGKTYLLLWCEWSKKLIDERGFINFGSISAMKLIHVEGFRFMSLDEGEGEPRPTVIQRALNVYGSNLILDLEEKFDLSIKPRVYGSAPKLGRLLVRNTGWGQNRFLEICPLALVSSGMSLPTKSYQFKRWSQENHPVLHNYTDDGEFDWNAWGDSEFLAFELPTHISIPISFNFPQGGI